jgi:hypothetical protein
MKRMHVIATWQSEHVVEVDDRAEPADIARYLGGQSNVTLVDCTMRPLEEVVDAAVDELLGPAGSTDV